MSLHNFSLKNLYFFLVSFICLLVVLFNAQAFLTITFRYFIFKTAPEYSYSPPFLPLSMPPSRVKVMPIYDDGMIEESRTEEIAEALIQNQSLNQEQKLMITDWLGTYNNWKQEQDNNRKQVMDNLLSNFIALIIFLPAFVYHFRKAMESAPESVRSHSHHN